MRTTQQRLKQTQEIQVEPMWLLMAQIGGHAQPAQVKTYSWESECAITREMPAITDEEVAA